MTKTQILKYIFNLFIFALPLLSFAQNKNKVEQERQFFIRPGIDLSRFLLGPIHGKQHSSIELNLDCEIKYRYFPTLELGTHKIENNSENYKYKSQGNYVRIGLNYNMLNYRHRFDRNLLFIGFIYGYSRLKHEAPFVSLSNEWGTYQTSIEPKNINSQWVEAVIGIRGEIFKNFYLGYTIRIKQLVAPKSFDKFTPYWIPGYGKGAKKRVLGMSYSLSYAIPIINPKPNFDKR